MQKLVKNYVIENHLTIFPELCKTKNSELMIIIIVMMIKIKVLRCIFLLNYFIQLSTVLFHLHLHIKLTMLNSL